MHMRTNLSQFSWQIFLRMLFLVKISDESNFTILLKTRGNFPTVLKNIMNQNQSKSLYWPYEDVSARDERNPCHSVMTAITQRSVNSPSAFLCF